MIPLTQKHTTVHRHLQSKDNLQVHDGEKGKLLLLFLTCELALIITHHYSAAVFTSAVNMSAITVLHSCAIISKMVPSYSRLNFYI